jgi:hypothetical protein
LVDQCDQFVSEFENSSYPKKLPKILNEVPKHLSTSKPVSMPKYSLIANLKQHNIFIKVGFIASRIVKNNH